MRTRCDPSTHPSKLEVCPAPVRRTDTPTEEDTRPGDVVTRASVQVFAGAGRRLDEAAAELGVASGAALSADRGRRYLEAAERASQVGLEPAEFALAQAEAELNAAPESSGWGRERLGRAAVIAVVAAARDPSQVVAEARRDPAALDRMLEAARRLLPADLEPETEHGRQGRALLLEVERALDAAQVSFVRAQAELEAGRAHTGTLVRSLGRDEQRLESAKSSVLAKLPVAAFQRLFGHEDGDKLQEEAAQLRLAEVDAATRRQLEGASALHQGFEQARESGQPFRYLASLWTVARPGLREQDPAAFRRARDGLPRGVMTFVDVALLRREVPAVAPLASGLFALDAAAAIGPVQPAITREMVELALEPGESALRASGEGATSLMVVNTSLEAMLGVMISGGIASTALYGRVAQTFQLAKLASLPPAVAGVVTHVGVGAATLGVGFGARKVLGEDSEVARGLDQAVGWLPIGVAHRAAQVGAAATRGLRAGAQLSAHAPGLMLAGAQAAAVASAAPWVGEKLELRGEVGQAFLGLALGALASGAVGAAASAQAGRRSLSHRALSRGLAQAVTASGPVAKQLDTELAAFARATRSRAPEASDFRALRAKLLAALGADPASVDPKQVACVEAAVESLQVHAAARGLAAGLDLSRMKPDQLDDLLAAVSARIASSREGPKDPLRWAQARQDGLRGLEAELRARGVRIGPELLATLQDWARATEVVAQVPWEAAGASGAQVPDLDRVATRVKDALPAFRAQLSGATRGVRAAGALRTRLASELGLPEARIDEIVGLTQVQLIQSVSIHRLRDLQSRSNVPLGPGEAARVVHEAATRVGVDPERAGRLANNLASSANFEARWSSARDPSLASPAEHRRAFLNRVPEPAKAALAQLDVHEFQEVFGEGSVPLAAVGLAELPGFVALAKVDAQAARRLVALEIFDPGSAQRFLDQDSRAGLYGVVAKARVVLPRVEAHPTLPDYVVVRRGPDSPPWVPALMLRPTKQQDHNGAFHAPAILDAPEGLNALPSTHLDLRAMSPEQLIVNGRPLESMDAVMVFSGHGSPTGISDLSAERVALEIADQLAAHVPAGSLMHVVLEACHQRDARGWLSPSSGMDIRQALLRILKARGLPAVNVLVADQAGPTAGPVATDRAGGQQLVRRAWRSETERRPVRYTEADRGAGASLAAAAAKAKEAEKTER